MTTTVDIAANLDEVRETIARACARVQRDPADVTLVAVSKRKPSQDILTAIAAGVSHFGENRIEEARAKIPYIHALVDTKPVWHMIGQVQSRKAKFIPGLFDVVESVDTVKLAEKLSRIGEVTAEPLVVLLEVNISGEAAKSGFAAANWQSDPKVKETLWQELEHILGLGGLNVRGLMTMAPFVEDMETTRPVFAELAALRDALQTDFHIALPDLSMGMTNDYPVAIEEGATIVRIGRAIFGARD